MHLQCEWACVNILFVKKDRPSQSVAAMAAAWKFIAEKNKIFNGSFGIRLLGGNLGFRSFSTTTTDDLSLPELPPFDYQPKPYKGPLADEVFEKRKKYLGPSLFHYYQKPVRNIPFFIIMIFSSLCLEFCAFYLMISKP